MFHKLFADGGEKAMDLYTKAKELVDSDKAKEVEKKYKDFYKEQKVASSVAQAIAQEEVAAAGVEEVFKSKEAWEYILGEEPSFADKVLSFFRKSARDYSSIDGLSAQARKLVRQYKKLFDSISESNKGNNALSIALEGAGGNTDLTGIKIKKDIDEYPYNMQTVIKEYIDSVDDKMLEFVKDAKNETNKKRLEYMHHNFANNLPENVLDDIKKIVGFDVTEYGITLNGEGIHHIDRRHGKNGKHDHSMQEENDIARMQYVINNADKAEVTINSSNEVVKDRQYRNADNTEAHVVSITKRINGAYYVVCAVPDSKTKKCA